MKKSTEKKTFLIKFKPRLPHPTKFGESILVDKIESVLVGAKSQAAARDWFISGTHAVIVSIESYGPKRPSQREILDEFIIALQEKGGSEDRIFAQISRKYKLTLKQKQSLAREIDKAFGYDPKDEPKKTRKKKPSGKKRKASARKANGLTPSQFLAHLKEIEHKGAGFFNRNSDGTYTIWVRGAHGNDPSQWHNATEISKAFGGLVKEGPTPDPQSGLLRIVVREPGQTGGEKRAECSNCHALTSRPKLLSGDPFHLSQTAPSRGEKHPYCKKCAEKAKTQKQVTAASKKKARRPISKGVHSPGRGHTIRELTRLKEMGWHNPDTGTEISEGEGEEHLQRLQEKAAEKKAASLIYSESHSQTRKASASPDDFFGESDKRDRAPLKRPRTQRAR